MTDEVYMAQALTLAREAATEGDVPVGCVIVDETGSVIGTGRNRREEASDATAHAEVEAIRMACKAVGSWRLHKCRLYVTLEPCPMCAGAILNARIRRVWFGARDRCFGACGGVTNLFMEDFPHPEVHYGVREEKTGACGSVLNLFEEGFGSRPRLYRGPLEAECAQLLADFFQSRREDGSLHL